MFFLRFLSFVDAAFATCPSYLCLLPRDRLRARLTIGKLLGPIPTPHRANKEIGCLTTRANRAISVMCVRGEGDVEKGGEKYRLKRRI